MTRRRTRNPILAGAPGALVGLGALCALGALAALPSAAAAASWDDLWNCEVHIAATEPAWAVNCPAGDGERLDEARGDLGYDLDATITVILRDLNYDPIPNFPATDLWLETEDPQIVVCPGGTTADADTDSNGETTFSGPFQAGGCGSGVRVMVNGMAIPAAPLDLTFVSPDLDGNLVVDLSDVVIFAMSYFGAYDPCCDLRHDGTINLSDLVVLAMHLGHSCP